MAYRRKLFLIIFAAGILPTLTVLAVSIYVIDSALSRVGATSLGNSLLAANRLVDETQELAGELLRERIAGADPNLRVGPSEIESWRRTHSLDLAFCRNLDTFMVSLADSASLEGNFVIGDFPTQPGLSRIEKDGRYFLIYTLPGGFGGGRLMPSNYSRLGRELAAASAATASLDLYRGFSLKLLAVISVLTIAAALLVAGGLSVWLSNQLVRPVRKLRDGAAHFAGGNFDYRIELGRHDEFTHLAESFNEMAREIKSNQQKLISAERLAAWREVARRIAHEIRNPLTPIGIELYRLKSMYPSAGGPLSVEIGQALGAIGAQVGVLQELSTQFSTFAKEPELKKAPCSIKDIIMELAQLFEADDTVRITVNLPDELPSLDLDPAMMRRAFLNILKNSAESGSAIVEIGITVVQYNDRLIVTFRDNGPGFPPEKLSRIDQPYLTTKSAGTGLGIVIVKKIIEEHGGLARFFNDSGAVVEISLPMTTS